MAEEHAATLVRQRVIEEKKMKELEKIREQLEKCLEEEKQAKKDEEIVRQLQARVLEEEWGRRDQLEKLQKSNLWVRASIFTHGTSTCFNIACLQVCDERVLSWGGGPPGAAEAASRVASLQLHVWLLHGAV